MIRSRFYLTIAATALMLTQHPASAAGQAGVVNVTGKWMLSVKTSAGTGTPTLTLTQKGDSITGRYSSQVLGEADVTGTIKGQSLTLKLNVEVQGTPLVVTYAATVDGTDTMTGTVDIGGQATGTFTGKRQ